MSISSQLAELERSIEEYFRDKVRYEWRQRETEEVEEMGQKAKFYSTEAYSRYLREDFPVAEEAEHEAWRELQNTEYRVESLIKVLRNNPNLSDSQKKQLELLVDKKNREKRIQEEKRRQEEKHRQEERRRENERMRIQQEAQRIAREEKEERRKKNKQLIMRILIPLIVILVVVTVVVIAWPGGI